MKNPIKVLFRKGEGSATITATVDTSGIEDMMQVRLMSEAVKEMARVWVEKEGATMLKSISNKEVKKKIEAELAKRFWQ